MRPGITFQREFSLLDGKERTNPIQPLRSQPALVQIGQTRVMARIEIAPEPTEEAKRQFARNFALSRNHTCAATEMGEWCGHKI